MIFQIIKKENSSDCPVEKMCQILMISRSSYYDWLEREPSERQKQNEKILKVMKEFNMIVRTWHGIVPLEKAEGFRNYLLNTGVSEAKAVPGNIEAYIYSQLQDGFEHFFMVSYWESIEAIRGFAGPNHHIAVTYPEDNKYCLISDPIVLHFEVQKAPSEFSLFFE